MEGDATVDLGTDTTLTIVAGDFHSNGDLLASEGSALVSDLAVTAKRRLLCSASDPASCFPPQATTARNQTDPLSDLTGSFPNQGRSQQWPSCDDVCVVEPGTYRGPITVAEGTEIVLSPGYYRFSSGVLEVDGLLRLDADAAAHEEAGDGLTLMFDRNASLQIGETGGLRFKAPTDGPYENIAIYYSRSNQNTIGWRASNNFMTGWVYAKQGHLRLEADADWTVGNRFVVRSMSSAGGNFTIDAGSTAPPFTPVADVVPIFECHIEQLDGTYTACFGYENRTVDVDGTVIPIEVPVGVDNVVTPAAFDGLQPTSFVVGRTGLEDAEPNAFVIQGWNGSEITWTLTGQSATSTLDNNCASQPPLPGICFGLRATIEGTDEDDVIVGTDGDDVIFAGNGDDVVNGLGGNDRICGGDGEDVLNGDDGDDLIDGEAGHDVVDGGAGADELSGGDGDDAILGGMATTRSKAAQAVTPCAAMPATIS